jgi:threonine-phosphate decarboxylase
MINNIHGGDIWSHQDKELLDFSASLNPLGMPPEVLQGAQTGVLLSVHYPDPNCTALREAISKAEHIPTEYLLCGNGGAELLDRLVLALKPKRAMILAPTFGEYERTLQVNDCKVFYHYLKKEQDFDLTEDILRVLRPDLDLLILCNPNNPTGRVISKDLLLKILHRCQKLKITLLVDESFLSLTDKEKQENLAPYVAEFPSLLLLRSMTKSYAMPGLRLGYFVSQNTDLLDKMKLTGQPWSVSLPAQMAGIAALNCPRWAEQGNQLVRPQRERLMTALRGFGFQVWESSVNYLLFRVPGRTDLREALLKHHILIRSCANFRGLGKNFYRIAVRTESENTALLHALEQVIGKKENYGTAHYDSRDDF